LLLYSWLRCVFISVGLLFALGWRVGFLVFFISVGMCSLHCVGLRRLKFFPVVLKFFLLGGDV
jgi:hypothetical protein